uniref:histidinol-phosphatase n=1 Tax=Agathobacter sp. TaxID=2021311 RepID=UPI004055FCA1
MKPYLTANYHTHTYRCQHAWGTEREYIERAIAAGIKKLGFSDHVPCPFKNGFVSKIRMRMSQAEEYVSTIRALGEEYKDRIQIYVGFETEYIPEFFDEQIELFHKLGCDYMIMGQHFLASEAEGPYAGRAHDSAEFLKDYVDSIIEGMRTGYFAYLAHPDLNNYNFDKGIYEKEMRRLCENMKELSIPLELNLLGILNKKSYPREEFWQIAGSVGNDVILGIDAHKAEQIGHTETYEKAMELVKKYHLRVVEELEF